MFRATLRLEALRVRERPGHATVTVSALTTEQLRQAYGKEHHFPAILPGVAPRAANAAQWRMDVRAQLQLRATATLCLMVARDPLRKGLDTALKALQKSPDDTHLLVVGGNATTRTWFAQSPYALRLQARVHLLDAVADVRPYYAAADYCLHPTLGDSFGMAPLEAMAYGLPVILSPMPWCGFAQYLQHHRDALLLDHPENAQQLADFIQQLRTEPALVERLRAQGLHIAAQHSWQNVARQYQAIYAQVLTERLPSQHLN